MTVGRGPAVYETGADVVATRVPLQLLKVPVLQPPGIPVAWTVTACGPGATGVNETKVLCPGASGSEVKIEPSTPIATWMSEQWLGEAVNWSWAMPSEVMEVVKVGSQVSPIEVQVTTIGMENVSVFAGAGPYFVDSNLNGRYDTGDLPNDEKGGRGPGLGQVPRVPLHAPAHLHQQAAALRAPGPRQAPWPGHLTALPSCVDTRLSSSDAPSTYSSTPRSRPPGASGLNATGSPLSLSTQLRNAVSPRRG